MMMMIHVAKYRQYRNRHQYRDSFQRFAGAFLSYSFCSYSGQIDVSTWTLAIVYWSLMFVAPPAADVAIPDTVVSSRNEYDEVLIDSAALHAPVRTSDAIFGPSSIRTRRRLSSTIDETLTQQSPDKFCPPNSLYRVRLNLVDYWAHSMGP